MTQTHSKPKVWRKRVGSNLTETIVVITLVGMLMGIVASGVASMYRVYKDGEQYRNHQSIQASLANKFRSDAHHATSATLEDDELHLHLSDGSSVSYAATDTGIQRTVVRDNEAVHQDEFRVDAKESRKFTHDERLVAIQIDEFRIAASTGGSP